MKTQIKKALCICSGILFFNLSVGHCSSGPEKNDDASAIVQQIKELGENIKGYSQAKSRTVSKKFENTFNQLQQNIKSVEQSQQQAFRTRFSQLQKQYQSIASKTEKKKKQAYKKTLKALTRLNTEVAKAKTSDKLDNDKASE